MPQVCKFSSNEIMKYGLKLLGFSEDRQNKVKRQTNVKRFKALYGSHPDVYREMFIDLQTISNAKYKLVVKKPWKDLKAFLITIHFLAKYREETDESAQFQLSDRTIRDKKWKLACAIQHLKYKKITWPEEWEVAPDSAEFGQIPIFLVSVDGIHCLVNEPSHGTWSKNPDYYSHKFKRAGLAYEVAISVFMNRVVSINGPFPASVNDTTIFKGGVRKKIPSGRQAVVDNGYKGKDPTMSRPNPLDSKAVRQFKGRVRSRQECFNAGLKRFKCLRDQFRHGETKHKVCFEAVAVICQYQMENGSPLFDV